MQKKFILAQALLCLTLSVRSQSAGNMVYSPSSVGNRYGAPQMLAYTPPPGVNLNIPSMQRSTQTVKADVMINVKATSYTAIFSITQNARTLEQVDSFMNIRIQSFLKGIRSIPSIRFEHHTDVISLVPRYKQVTEEKRFSRTVNEVPDGFEMKKNVHILFFDHDHLSPIMAAAGKAEIYELVKVEYNVANTDEVYEQLRTKALEVVHHKQEKRSAMGFKLEQLSLGEIQGAVYPIERYAHYTAYRSGTPEYVVLEERRRKDKGTPITTSVSHMEKSPTIYYERIPYNQFDVVMNTAVAEPCVQFYYSLQVEFKVVNDADEQIRQEDRALAVEMKKAEIYQRYHPEGKPDAAKRPH